MDAILPSNMSGKHWPCENKSHNNDLILYICNVGCFAYLSLLLGKTCKMADRFSIIFAQQLDERNKQDALLKGRVQKLKVQKYGLWPQVIALFWAIRAKNKRTDILIYHCWGQSNLKTRQLELKISDPLSPYPKITLRTGNCLKEGSQNLRAQKFGLWPLKGEGHLKSNPYSNLRKHLNLKYSF